MRFFAVLCLFLAGVGTQSSPSQSAQSNEQKARAVIDRMIAVLGGQAYLNVQDSYSDGRYGRFHNEQMVASNVFFRYWKWPDQERYEITDKRDVVYLFLGDKEYEVIYRGSSEMSPVKDDSVRQALLRRRHTLDTVLRTWLNAPGTILLDEGQTVAESQMAEKVTIMNANDDAVTILVSIDTHLPIAKIFSVRDPQSRERDEEIEVYGNWRMVQDINTPYSVQIKRNGELMRTESLANITYNIHPP
ncbi:MAG TPA: hypothetical protein VI488_11035, partial [Candidatus Angelobacter sp.]